jgi:chromosome segregation ATPase
MQSMRVVLLLLGVICAEGVQKNPLSETVALLDGLQAKILNEGELELKAFNEYSLWCVDYIQDTKNEITTATMQKGKLEAKLAEHTALIEVAVPKIADLGAAIQAAEREKQGAIEIRTKEAADFGVAEKELMEALNVLDRAIAVLRRDMAKNPAALMQLDTSNMANLIKSIDAVINAAAFSSADRQSLTALLQSQQGSDSEDGDVGAPAAAVYKTHSTNIVEVLEDMREKAETQLGNLRKAEVNTRHNFEMLRQSLEDQIAEDGKAMDKTKAEKAATAEAKAVAIADLADTGKELGSLQGALAGADDTCKRVASDHEATVSARTEELKVIAEALEVLRSTTSGAVGQTYSLLQVSVVSGMHTHSDLVKSEVLVLVKRLAKQHHSAALAQLASRIAATVQLGQSNGDDVFGKVKGLIRDLIARLEGEASADATEKAFCDWETAKTEEKKGELDDDIAKLNSKIDTASARSANLKADVRDLQAELAALARAQAKMDEIRAEAHADYINAKADLEQGLAGVRKAFVVLRDYYNVDASLMVDVGSFMQQPAKPDLFVAGRGTASSILGILQVVESDFAANLAKEEMQEADEQAAYEKMTQENSIVKTVKDQGVSYKTAEFKTLDKNINEMSSDRKTAHTELDAVLQYLSQLRARCVAKPETYESRRDRRAAEIAGLKHAQEILQNEVAFLQHNHRGGNMRGALSL